MTPSRRPPPGLALDSPLVALRGLGPKRAAAWAASGVATIGDLLRVPPRRHARFDAPTPIAALVEGQPACLRVRVVRRKGSGRRGVVATRLDVKDDSGELTAVLFGPNWLVRSFARDEEVVLRGELRRNASSASSRQFLVRAWLHAEELPAERVAVLQPHYALPEGVAPRLHRRVVAAALEATREWVDLAKPKWFAGELAAEFGGGRSWSELLRALHVPRDDVDAIAARRAFAFDEAIAIQTRLRSLRRERALRPDGPYESIDAWLEEYVADLPFAPTGDQRRALAEIAADLRSDRAMSRLLSGDVGSGKSAVAFLPLIVAARAGRQAALLAPTELLARQHCATLGALAARRGLPPPQLVTGGSRARTAARLDAPLVVGTHALTSAPVRFRDLAVVVVDEQHKFGVRQRSRLFDKGRRPDLLLVSATPIPRTLAHTLFGHLDLSLLAERPAFGRAVTSELLVGGARRAVGSRVRAELERGGKAFVVCPAIGGGRDVAQTDEPSERRPVASAERVAPWLAKEVGARFRVELLHGRLDADEKCARLEAFTRGEVRVLVATVVVEVGIDVPDATLAVVLGAERFGLSQLHQIRGRIGRRGDAASCLLVSADPSDEARARLEEFARTDDGFKLAELDLARRGPGELLGTQQHGLARGLYPEALLDPQLVGRAKEFVERPHAPRKSMEERGFGERAVASSEWIW